MPQEFQQRPKRKSDSSQSSGGMYDEPGTAPSSPFHRSDSTNDALAGADKTLGDIDRALAGYDASGNKSISPEDLRSKEEAGGGGGEASDYGSGSAATAPAQKELSRLGAGAAPMAENPLNYTGGKEQAQGISRIKAFLGKRGSKKRRRALLIAGAGSGVVALVCIMFLLTLVGSFKLQDLAAHVTEQNLVRVYNDYQNSAADMTAESLGKDAVDSSGTSLVSRLKAQYGDLRSATWGKLDPLRPAKVIDNLEASGRLQYVYDEVPRTILPGTQLVQKAVILDGTRIELPPGRLSRLFTASGDGIHFNSDLGAAFKDATPETFGLVRSQAVAVIREKLGVKLFAWERAGTPFAGKSEAEAFTLQQQESAATVEQPATPNAAVDEVNQAAQDAKTKEQAAIQSGQAAETNLAQVAIADQSVLTKIKAFPDTVRVSIDGALSGLQQNFLLLGLKYFNGFYKVAFPLCLIYDGSVVSNTPEIDAKSTALQKEGYQLMSARDQTNTGDTVAEARGAYDDKLGNITDSVPERLARGELVDTRQVAVGPDQPQAGGAGTLATDRNTLLTTYFGRNPLTDNLDIVIQKICPAITSPAGIGASLGGQIATFLLSGGSGAAAETAATEGITEAVGGIVAESGAEIAASSATQEVVTTAIQQTLGQKMKGFMLRVGVETAAIAGVQLLFRMDVENHMNSTYTGLDYGSDYATQTAMGMNLHASEVERQVMKGRPMTATEVAQSDTATQQYLALKRSKESIANRYFALSNPDSLLSTAGMWTVGQINYLKGPGRISQVVLGVFSDMASMFTHFRLPFMGHALAATAPVDTTYGIVQWGWSTEENNLIANNSTYGPLENAEYWAHRVNPQVQQDIQNKYGKCFTETMGQLLGDGSITRAADGSITGGDCSPDNLGPHNSVYGDQVFRWRLVQRNEQMADQLTDIQNAN